MKGTLALFVVCMLLVVSLTPGFAAKKTSSDGPQVFQREIEEAPVQSPEGSNAPNYVRPRASASFVPIAAGTYTIGAAGTYPTLSAAVTDLQTNGIDGLGTVTFRFIDATYSDSGQTIGGYFNSGVSPVVFDVAPGNIATILFTGGVAPSNSWGIRLDNAKMVTIDGGGVGPLGRSLTLAADTATAVSRNGVLIQKGSKDVTLKNCIIKGNRRAASNSFGVIRVVNTTFAAFGGQNNITIDNNHLMRGLDGIQWAGAGTATLVLDTAAVIKNNTIGGVADADLLQHIAQFGMYIQGTVNAVIEDNDVNGLRLATTAGSSFVGIRAENANVNMVIRRNQIHNMLLYAGAGRPNGIMLSSGALSAGSTRSTFGVYNNMIYDLRNLGTGSRVYRGFSLAAFGGPPAGTGMTAYAAHNTVHIAGNPGDNIAGTGFGLELSGFGAGAAPDSLYFTNNILSHATSPGGFSRSFLTFAGVVGMHTFISNNNTFYRPDGGAFGQWVNDPWPTGPTATVSSLSDWQTDTGNDVASVEGNPQLISNFDLHVNTAVGVVSAADSVGAAGTGIAFDIDGAPRDPAFPDAGADEFVVTRFVTDLEATTVDFPAPTLVMAASAAFSPMATFTNRGSGTLTSAASAYCEILDGTPAVVYTSSPASVSVGGYDNTTQITFSSVIGGLPAGVYTIRAIAAIAGDASGANDTVTSTLLVQASISSTSFPYLEDFEDPSPETGGAGWLTGADAGSANDWVIGTPAKPIITGAHSGLKSYVTKTSGDYTVSQESYIFAPILDLSTFTDVLLVEFYSNFSTEHEWDGCELQMSVDGGVTWFKVDSTLGTGGNFNTTNSTAWYNNNVNQHIATNIPWWSGGDPGDGGFGSNTYATADATGYVRSSTAITGVAGLPDVRFRWHFSSDTSVNGDGWSVDDVSFSALNADDIGVSSVGIAGYVGGPVPNGPALRGRNGEVLSPNSTNRPSVKSLGAVVAGSSIDFETITKNYGSNTQATYSVGLNIDGAGEDSDVNTDPLGFSDDDTLTLSWAAPTTGIHTADAWTVLAGDEDASNDTASFDFEVLAPEVVYYEGFNSGTWPSPGWDTLDVDGIGVEPGASWQQDVIAIYEGAHSAGGFYGQSNGTYIDDWLISPNTGGLLDVSYTVDSLSFYAVAAGGGFPDSIMILVSTVDTDPANFTTVLDYVEIPSSGWTKYTYALPDAAVRHIAFRYLHYDGGLTGNNSNAFSLDDVRITRYNFANGLTANPGSISFGSVPVGFSSNDTVEVKNLGNVALAISSVASDDANFTVSPAAGAIAPGDSADFVVTFTPASTGSKSGNIVFTSDADSSPDTVTVDGIGGAALMFTSLSPDSVFNEDPLKIGKSKKPVKRHKGLYPNWSNLLDEVNAQGGFGPGASESDSAGGMVIGTSYMFNAGGAGPAAKWKAVKDSAKIYCWVRLAKWDFKKSIGKSFANIQKTLIDKTIGKHTGAASGLDSVTTPGKFKQLAKQLTKLTPKTQNNALFAELVALKVNIAASAMGKTPAGFGDLIFDVDGNPLDEMTIIDLSNEADDMMTHWQGHTQDEYDSLYSAVYNINRAFLGTLDTLTFETTSIPFPLGKLTIAGKVNLAAVPFLKVSMPFVATRISALNGEVESPEDFDTDDEFDAEAMPVAAQLMQNFPNPFNPSTTIAFRLKEVSKVTIKVFNLLGQEVATLVNGEELEEGAQSMQFSAELLSSGVYFYRIEAQGLEDAALKTIETRKMLLLK